jgi:hypothetical protein
MDYAGKALHSSLFTTFVNYTRKKFYKIGPRSPAPKTEAEMTGANPTRDTKGGKYHYTVDLLVDRFGISCMTTDNFCFYLQNRLIQTS